MFYSFVVIYSSSLALERLSFTHFLKSSTDRPPWYFCGFALSPFFTQKIVGYPLTLYAGCPKVLIQIKSFSISFSSVKSSHLPTSLAVASKSPIITESSSFIDSANSSHAGAILLQWPHHGAYILIKTSASEFITISSKFLPTIFLLAP